MRCNLSSTQTFTFEEKTYIYKYLKGKKPKIVRYQRRRQKNPLFSYRDLPCFEDFLKFLINFRHIACILARLLLFFLLAKRTKVTRLSTWKCTSKLLQEINHSWCRRVVRQRKVVRQASFPLWEPNAPSEAQYWTYRTFPQRIKASNP